MATIADSLTIDTLVFDKKYSQNTGSLRREVSRGVNLPTELKIAHSPYVDSATKLPGLRSLVRFDRVVNLTGGKTATVSAYVVVTRPNDPTIVNADITAVVQHLVSFLQEDDSGLDLMDEVFLNQLQ